MTLKVRRALHPNASRDGPLVARAPIRRSRVLGALLAPAAARAAPPTRSGFQPAAPRRLTVNENAGQAVITVVRDRHRQAAQIRYITLGDGVKCGAANAPRSLPTTSTRSRESSTFPPARPARRSPSRSSTTAYSERPEDDQVSLFGPSPIGMASPRKAMLTILDDDPVTPRDP